MDIIVFCTLVVALLWFDLHYHGKSGAITTKSAVSWTLFYIAVSLAFAAYIYFSMGPSYAALYLTGWGLEKVLAIDNLIVFAAIFSYFGIKEEHKHRILYMGVIGAIVLRLVFVAIGVSLAHAIGAKAEIIFAIIILYTAWVMYSSNGENYVEYKDSWYIRYTKKWLPVTHETNGSDFFIRGKATPLLFALIAIELSDIMFAFDSVPAIIAITKEPFLIYSSIIFAILGLRSMFFVLSALTKELQYLETAVITVLVFIAGKLLLNATTGIDIDPTINLTIVLAILFSGAIISKMRPNK